MKVRKQGCSRLFKAVLSRTSFCKSSVWIIQGIYTTRHLSVFTFMQPRVIMKDCEIQRPGPSEERNLQTECVRLGGRLVGAPAQLIDKIQESVSITIFNSNNLTNRNTAGRS